MSVPEWGHGLAPWERHPYRLWSLWEIMRLEKLGWFVACIRDITHQRDLWLIEKDSPLKVDPGFQQSLECLLGFAEEYDLTETQKIVKRMQQGIAESLSPQFLAEGVSLIIQTFRTETQLARFLYVDQIHAGYYGLDPEGDELEKRFGILPECIYRVAAADLREALKCFSLYRSTATVLHCSRALEVVITDVIWKAAGSPRVPNKPTWGDYSKAIQARAQENQKNGSWDPTRVLYFNTIVSDFDRVKDAERKAVCHHGVMFQDDRAKALLDHTATLLRHAAEHLDASGDYSPNPHHPAPRPLASGPESHSAPLPA